MPSPSRDQLVRALKQSGLIDMTKSLDDLLKQAKPGTITISNPDEQQLTIAYDSNKWFAVVP